MTIISQGMELSGVRQHLMSHQTRTMLGTLEREEDEETIEAGAFTLIYARIGQNFALEEVIGISRTTLGELAPILMDHLGIPNAQFNPEYLRSVIDQSMEIFKQIHENKHAWAKYLPVFHPDMQPTLEQTVIQFRLAMLLYKDDGEYEALPYVTFALSQDPHVLEADREPISVMPPGM